MKSLFKLLFVCYMISKCLSIKSNFAFSKSELEMKSKPYHAKLPDGEVLWQGWIKYFHYASGLHAKNPLDFFINNEFFNQRVTKEDFTKKDEIGSIHIPNQLSFYGKFLRNSFNVLSTRQNHYSKTVDTLNFDTIKLIDPLTPIKGAIKDLGKFKEGSCISISTLQPTNYQKNFIPLEESNNTQPRTWIICLDSDREKEKLYSYILTYKLILQKQKNIVFETKDEQPLEKTPKKEYYEGPGANKLLDGYLILLNDWTQCTMKCGGGESFQQWQCIPPKTGGHQCVGELVRKKPCNLDPCPGVTSKKEGKGEEVVEKTLTGTPIFRSMPFIERPQQNVDCVIRESDVFYDIYNEKLNKTLKLPGRLLMNTDTISLFKDSTYDNGLFNFNLQRSHIKLHKDEFCCFFVESENRKFKVCGLGGECGSAENPIFVKSWARSFSLFKKKCYKEKKTINASRIDDLKNPKSNDWGSNVLGHMNIESADAEEREKKIEQKIEKGTDESLESKVLSTQQSSLKAITREIDLEERLKREEMMKAKDETNKLIVEMRKEQEKKQKLEEAIEDRETNEAKVVQRRKVTKSISKMVKETESKILSKRQDLKDKIMRIREKANRRKRLIQQKINMIRGKMAKDLIDANKKGSHETCKKAKESKSTIASYCDENVINDYERNKDCKNPENFCYVCCETEFGNIQISGRENCFNMCDGKIEDKPKTVDLGGDWAWK